MTPLPTAVCPSCGRTVPLRRNGTMREHRTAERNPAKCSASGTAPWAWQALTLF